MLLEIINQSNLISFITFAFPILFKKAYILLVVLVTNHVNIYQVARRFSCASFCKRDENIISIFIFIVINVNVYIYLYHSGLRHWHWDNPEALT